MRQDDQTQATRGVPAWLKVIGGLLAFVLLAIGIIFALGTISTSRWQRFAYELRADGQPLTLAEIEEMRPTVPDDRNGALVITENLGTISGVTAGGVDREVFIFGSDGRESGFFSGIVRSGIEPSRALRDRNQALLEELAKLADMPTGRFELAHQRNPLATLLPHLAQLRTASKLLAVDGMLKLIDGDVEGAVRSVEAQFGVAGTLQNEPTIISRLVQIAIQALGVRGIEQVLRAAEPDAQQLRRLEEQVEQALAGQTMKWALWGERAVVIETLEGVATGSIGANNIQGATDIPGVLSTFWLPTWLVRDNQLRAAKLYGWLIGAADDPDAMLAAAKRIEAAVPKLSVKYALLKMLIPSLSRAMTLHIRIAAHLRATQAALAAERYRLDQGRFPTSLDELAPAYLDAVPVDPFDGRPLRLVTVPEGIVIYSIGEDGVDDGGIVARPGKSARLPDVGFRLHAPEHRGIAFKTREPPG